MATIGKWKNHKFVVSSKKIYSYENLQIKGGSNIEEKKKKKKPTVKRKGAKPMEVSLTVILNAFTGPNVRQEALLFVKEATKGSKGYFYTGNKKLMTCKLMLTDATVKNVEVTRGGSWSKAEVTLTLKQCTKGEANVSGGGGNGGKKKKKKKKGKNSKKASVRSTSPTTTPSGGRSSSSSSSTTSTSGYTNKKGFVPYYNMPKPTAPTRASTKSANQTVTALSKSAKASSVGKANTPAKRVSGH